MPAREPRGWLWRVTVVIPLIAGLLFLVLLGLYEVLDVCQAEQACEVVGTIAMWGAVGMLGFIFAARILIAVVGLVSLMISSARGPGPTNAHQG